MKKVICFLMLLASALTLCACSPGSPLSYPGSVWVCEEPYMWFVSSQDGVGTTGIGELQTEDGDTIAARFVFDRERGHSYIWREEDVYLENATVDGQEFVTAHKEDPILSGHYKMRGQSATVEVSMEDDQIYHGKYATIKFCRQFLAEAQN